MPYTSSILNLAEKYYDDNPSFRPKADENRPEDEIKQITKIHQAIAMIQFKLESPIIKNLIRLRSAVVNIADNMQMVDNQSLRAICKTGDQLISLAKRNDLIYDFGVILFFVGSFFCFIQQLLRNIDHLHVVGDIYDRGPQPDQIMEELINYHSVDIQWGNHDVLWIGAYSGSKVCLANIIRIDADNICQAYFRA